MRERKKSLEDLKIDKSWTLFLDRDGVINKKIKGDYVRNWAQFEFLPGALEAIKGLSKLFGKIIIVTNQRGIARGLMTVDDLNYIHHRMLSEIKNVDGRINRIYFCPHNIEDNCDCRKPKIGMALNAKRDFPEINFKKSIVVGDSVLDMDFAKKLGALKIYIGTDRDIANDLYDIIAGSLYEFWKLMDK